jgi:hypothetical protein
MRFLTEESRVPACGDTINNKPITISACIGYNGQHIFIDKEIKLCPAAITNKQ